MYIQTRTYRATVGPIIQRATYVCPHCGVTCDILAQGWGEGSSVAMYDFSGGKASHQEAAAAAAQKQAEANARQALDTAPCPACGKPNPTVQSKLDHSERSHAQRKRLGKVLPAVAAGLLFLPLASRAFVELSYSAWFLASSIALCLALAATTLLILVWPRKSPLATTAAKVFYRRVPDPTAYRGADPEGDFVIAPERTAPSFGQARHAWVCAGAALLSGGAAMVGFLGHPMHFEALHIVSTAAPGTQIRVTQAGMTEQVFTIESTKDDAFHVAAKVVSSRSPHTVVVEESGARTSRREFRVPASLGGTIVASLFAKEEAQCLAIDKSGEEAQRTKLEPIAPDLWRTSNYVNYWLRSFESSSPYYSAVRLLPCDEIYTRRLRIASFAPAGTKLTVLQKGKPDQVFTVGSVNTDTDAYIVEARVYLGGDRTIVVRQDGAAAREQSFSMPSESGASEPNSDADVSEDAAGVKGAWLVVPGAAEQSRKCVGLLTDYYGGSARAPVRAGSAPAADDGKAPTYRKLPSYAEGVWEIPGKVDTWFTANPESVTRYGYRGLPSIEQSRTAVRIRDCAVLDALVKFSAMDPAEQKLTLDRLKDRRADADADDNDDNGSAETAAAPSSTVSVKAHAGRPVPRPAPSRPAK
jgi:hypothetical protein